MAKVKVINSNLNQNLNGTNFNDYPSNTIFSFGSFQLTSNFDNKRTIDYSNTLSTFVRTVTLDTMGISNVQSQILYDISTNAVLNLDNSDLNTFVKFGSAYEFLRVSIQNIILAYPGSLYASTSQIFGGNPTFLMITGGTGSTNAYDPITNITTFYVPKTCIVNTFGLVYNNGNVSVPDDNELKNLNLSYNKYVISTGYEPTVLYPIIGFTGNTINSSDGLYKNYLKFQVIGNPFKDVINIMPVTINSNIFGFTGNLNFHIRVNTEIFEEFRAQLTPYESNIVSFRNGIIGYEFTLKSPQLLDNGNIIYQNTNVIWTTNDGYNLDINTPQYQQFLQTVLNIGAKYDKIKTDLIARFLTPMSLKKYDLTEDGKVTKLLRIYGHEFDQIKQFIDSLVYVNKITYNKLNNVPDQIIMNMSRTFGWDYFSLVNESELIESFLTVSDVERNLNEDILPAEIDVELWRRILKNTSYFWKAKGTRESIKSMFLLIGIPEPFINITEYVYTVDGKINPNTVPILQQDFPTNSLPYDSSGYPVAPLESNSFYFQISGNTDGGQRYLDVFRMAGYNLSSTIDNKKSWIQTGSTTRMHYTTPQYYQEDSKLVINTKEIDVALDTARGIENDVYNYIQKDFTINNSGYTLPYSYVNISLGYSGTINTFTLPSTYNQNGTRGDLEVRFNGILLNAPKSGTTTGVTYQADYSIDEVTKTFTLLNSNVAINSGNRRDVIQATFIYSGNTQAISGITVQYVVTRVDANPSGTYIPLPSYPSGDIQLTINGIALTKGSGQFNADYILDPTNTTGSSRIIIQNQEIINYLKINPTIQIAYIEVLGSNDINLRSEIQRIDSFNTSKIYFNSGANKYVYKLNYKANSVNDIKFLIDGIALEPIKDYDINVMNPYEVFLPKGLKYGTIISVYYLVGGNSIFQPVVSNTFGLGDISNLSFLEFLELAQRKMINTRNRKTISDFKGGWYPSLLKIYEIYAQRSLLSTNNTLHSNGYTFENLYPFLSKYNAFFQRFVDQLLPATIILKKSGLLVRNTIFTKQKYTYKRGVNVFNANYVTLSNNNYRNTLQYLGDGGSLFMIPQNSEPVPHELSVETLSGMSGIGELNNIGGTNIIGYSGLTQYGVQYRLAGVTSWIQYPLINGSLSTNTYALSISGLSEDASYEYRAIVISNTLTATGNILTLKTGKTIVIPLIPSGLTKQISSSTSTSLVNTGGYAIQRYSDVDWYGMQYSAITTSSPTAFNVIPSLFSGIPIGSGTATCNVTVIGDVNNTYTVSAGANTWLIPQAPQQILPIGVNTTVDVSRNNDCAGRTGCVCYIPVIGTPKFVEFQQLGTGLPPINYINVDNIVTTSTSESGKIDSTCLMTAGQCYYTTLCWELSKTTTTGNVYAEVYITCNGNNLYSCAIFGNFAKSCSGKWSNILVKNVDNVCIYTNVRGNYASPMVLNSSVCIENITNGVGNFNIDTALSCCTSVNSSYNFGI